MDRGWEMRGWMPYLLTVVVLASQGCAHVAKIPMWRAAAAPVSDVKMVGVVPFEGEWGKQVTEEVLVAFSKTGTYEIQPIGIDADGQDVTLDGVLAQAREMGDMGLDAVLIGEIVETPGDSNSLTVQYQLIDTRTGESLCRNEVHCLINERESKAPAAEAQQSLIQRCGYELVSQLTPQCGACSIKLATPGWTERGSISTRRGIRAAEEGKWEQAIAHWENARRINPDSDSAIFNLAIAAASQNNYDEAEELAMEAIRLRHSDCYEAGLERIRQQRTQFEAASSQGGVKVTSAQTWMVR
jgi:hypothetical protein